MLKVFFTYGIQTPPEKEPPFLKFGVLVLNRKFALVTAGNSRAVFLLPLRPLPPAFFDKEIQRYIKKKLFISICSIH
ncbi:MAG: hypothetical protein RMY28_019135 [Nostoc sp. ChiSLP01]|nr:hypothetical protein [Nostoc sp. CmiSLP01]MDZ8287169.1 hypothetical protein [Nostoc sp. ChiSLP01]